MYSMPFDDSAMEKSESGKIRSVSVDGNAILHRMIRASFAEKMTSEQRSEEGERARHTGKSMPNRIASVNILWP